jgi:hypothetical protein
VPPDVTQPEIVQIKAAGGSCCSGEHRE